MSDSSLTGGCQCGAVRYRIDGPLSNASICFCRMCQKSSGHLVGVYAATPLAAFRWTRGKAATFRSSEAAEREFCPVCGTNLTFRYLDKPRISVTIGSLDHPERAPVDRAYGIEGKQPWFDYVATMKGSRTEDDVPAADQPRYRPHQHPDHETDSWPPKKRSS